LVERFQAGDSAAFDELYCRYRDRLERFCLKRVGDRHSAEEVAQEAFTRALSAMPRFAGERRFYPWVTVIAARLCVDHHRRMARVEPAATLDLGPVDGGQDAVLTAVDAALVVKAMDRLGLRHQEVLRLREMEGWSYQRIADEYGVNIGTVDALLFRARRALRREFEAVGGALTAIPVVAGLGRVTGRIRDRITPLLGGNPAAVGSTAAATAAVAAFAVGLTLSPGAPAQSPSPALTQPSHVVTFNPAGGASGPSVAGAVSSESAAIRQGEATSAASSTGTSIASVATPTRSTPILVPTGAGSPPVDPNQPLVPQVFNPLLSPANPNPAQSPVVGAPAQPGSPGEGTAQHHPVRTFLEGVGF
jgi:RNA polymerase sigma factor (sigma-70 family)